MLHKASQQFKPQSARHTITEQLNQKVRHRTWLEQNLKNSQQVKHYKKEFFCSIMKRQNSVSDQLKFEAKNNKATLLQIAFFFTTTK